MTKKQAERYAYLLRALGNLGVSKEDADALLRIERTLHRWAERECNGEVGTDDDGTTWYYPPLSDGSGYSANRYRGPNLEAGALRRLAAIMSRYPALATYHQTDPRGCALYVCNVDKAAEYMEEQKLDRQGMGIDSCYSSVGVAVCYT